MAEIQFFHLTDGPVAATLPILLARAQERGWRVLIRGKDKSRMEALDLALWQGQKDGVFRPHGLVGGQHDELQPVLLAVEGDVVPHDCLISVDGAEVGFEEAEACTRTVIIFDGNDEQAVQHARLQWKALAGQKNAEGLVVPAAYFAQEFGRWNKKTERV